MRRIDRTKIAPDPEWDARAAEAAAAVESGENPSDYSDVWRAAKDRLKVLSCGKCWYCESRQERSDNAVDHFRPKSTYPWLAFSLPNFRYTCTFCNSIRTNPDTGEPGGKGSHFPLFNPPCATVPERVDDEDVVLLDPCRGSEPGLLDFREDGSACPKYPEQPKRRRRAEESIRLYHLDHPELVERRRELALQIKEWIIGADRIHRKMDQGEPDIEYAFTTFVETLLRKISEDAEFSVFAKRVIAGFRDKEWVEDLLQMT